MIRHTSNLAILLVLGLTNSVGVFAQSEKASIGTSGRSAVGDAFQSLFNPTATPRVRTMGSIQRTNFLDELLASRGKLQIAFVVDGTESMSSELEGIRQTLSTMVGDLRRVVGKGLAVQMVIYRDQGAASGPVSWPLSISKTSWAEDDATIVEGLKKLVPESGAPYFYEQTDAGLHAALSELAWSNDEDVQKWIFLIGDAPPFKSGFSEPSNQAARHFETELLKRLAEQKKIRIHGILCRSHEQDRAAYEKVLPECRVFFEEMTGASGGLLLDLSDTTIVNQVRSAAEQATQNFVALKPIFQSDIDSLVANSDQPIQKVSVAVLPFLSPSAMDFSPSNPMTQLAEEVRSQLDQNGIDTRHLSFVEKEFKNAKRRRTSDEALPQFIGEKLQVEYVIWGRSQDSTRGAFRAEVFNVRTGKAVAVTDGIPLSGSLSATPATTTIPANVRLCSLVIQSLATSSKTTNQPVAKVFSGKFQTRLVSTSEDGASALQEARLYLQRALSMGADIDSGDDLDRAEKALERVSAGESANPLWNNLMANVYFGKALQEKLRGNKRNVRRFLDVAKTRSDAAFNAKNSEKYSKEFEADHWFFQERFDKAIESYEAIVRESLSLETVARARWMLVFLYIGDWGVAKSTNLQNLDRARQHALSLMAFHPEAEETLALKAALHWSEFEGKTLLAVLPYEDVSPSDRIVRP